MEHQPKLSPPFHPSDIINRFLLNKNQNARVAITHDTQWMDMIKKGLTPDDLLQADRLGTFLTWYYTVDSEDENAVVFLQVKAASRLFLGGIQICLDSDDIEDSVSSVAGPHDPSSSELELSDPSTSDPEDISLPSSPEQDISAPTTPGLEVSSCPTPSIDCPQIVITRICAQNIPFGRKRFSIGFYVLVQVGGTRQRTQNKSIRVNDSDIEWEDVIFLPSQALTRSDSWYMPPPN
ncbi:hypothetical protein L210DRAFT_2465196 [Boletus edulis BED1]|uniref:C2 domain-containing protein n=1 Tax=Boletus edulis BED1 TaxID=1328754 RepID=A0AAD4G5Y6_BOLED|nr:hypothetical protein L210DRAFT_2465196 [Boletus edulis BED1]